MTEEEMEKIADMISNRIFAKDRGGYNSLQRRIC